jgi:hypothetical protein
MAMAIFANGDGGLSLMPPIIEGVMPERHACFEWLGLRDPALGGPGLED